MGWYLGSILTKYLLPRFPPRAFSILTAPWNGLPYPEWQRLCVNPSSNQFLLNILMAMDHISSFRNRWTTFLPNLTPSINELRKQQECLRSVKTSEILLQYSLRSPPSHTLAFQMTSYMTQMHPRIEKIFHVWPQDNAQASKYPFLHEMGYIPWVLFFFFVQWQRGGIFWLSGWYRSKNRW